MPRITHVISTPEGIGGAERVLEALCEGGEQRGWDQIVLNPFSHDPGSAALRSHVAGARYLGYRCALARDLPRARQWLGRQLEDASPEVVHVHLFHANVLTASLRARCPRVLTHHHGDGLVSGGRRFDAICDRLAGQRYDRVVAVSPWISRFLHDCYGYSASRIVTIVNGWGGAPLERAPSTDGPVIVAVGNLRREKGYDDLLRSFALLSARQPTVRLRVLGDGPDRDALEELARELRMESRLEWLGWVDQPWEELSRATIFATATRVEPLGIAALEAMAAGLPVVAPRVGGLGELVEDGVTGILVPPGDLGAIADALDRLLNNRAWAEQLGRAGARVAQGHRMKAMVDAYFALYEELM